MCACSMAMYSMHVVYFLLVDLFIVFTKLAARGSAFWYSCEVV